MARVRVSKNPSLYSPLPFHIFRLAQLLSASIVSCVVVYFVHFLRIEHYAIPWTFILVRGPIPQKDVALYLHSYPAPDSIVPQFSRPCLQQRALPPPHPPSQIQPHQQRQPPHPLDPRAQLHRPEYRMDSRSPLHLAHLEEPGRDHGL